MIETRRGLLLAFLILLGGLSAIARQQEGSATESAATEDPMARMQKMGTPGEHQKHLAKLAGNWETIGTFWMEPGAPPLKSSGQAESKMIMGGRFLESHFTGDFMGQPFTGMGIEGYDNDLQKHIGMWIDSSGTMMLTYEGTCSDDGKVLTTYSDFKDPATGNPVKMKNVTTRVDENHFKMESFIEMGGNSFKAMEIDYTRKQ